MELDPVEIALAVSAALESTGIDYVIGGSIASTLYGEPRATMDVDFAIQLETSQVDRLAAELEEDFYVDRSMLLEAAAEHRHSNVIHKKSMIKVDLYARPPRGIYIEEIRRAESMRLRTKPEGFAQVATPEDVVLQKLRWYRLGNEISDRQWRDVLGILKLRGGSMDRSYLDRWAAELSVDDILRRAFAEALP
ncbi:MAG: hypothetical protein GY722_03885 [bacterium]|nr:hypothetical protein [bacterium]